MAAEDDLDVGHLEPELLDGLLEQRQGLFEIRVDQDVALGRGEQERVQRPGSHRVDVRDHLV